MTVRFHPEARAEFLDSIAYYKRCAQGLGLAFRQEANAAIESALEHPLMWPFCYRHIRRCLVHRFPFGALYSPEPDDIFILAVMDLRRHPDYWKHRL
jgi:hypothetical protein